MKHELVINKLFSLLQASQEVSSTRDKARLLEAIVLSATRVVECKNSCLMLLHPESRELVAHVVVGDNKQTTREVRFKVGEGIAGWVAKHGDAVLSNDVQSDPRYSKKLDEVTDMPLQSILCIPLISKEKVLGVLNIINKPGGGRFTEEDLHLAQAFATQAAIAIDNANLYDAISKENKLLREQLDLAPKLLVSFNPHMKKVIEMARRAAESDATVLLLGESGTGKEIVARAIHTWSDRKTFPFVALNCTALPEQLLESEIFGHEEGAFTGAIRRKVGKIELANGGTLFLDEIGELKLDVQTKLLRVLQEHQFERVGGTKVITADLRIIAATNKDLLEEVQNGAFREDLFFRLNVISLTMPPLRERKED
ncbi:MAG: sigma 54-interacting transcriptional regulator, partial [bacterium]